MAGAKIAVRSPNVAGYSRNVDAAKYHAMKAVLLKVMPAKAPGITQSEMLAEVAKRAPKQTFPGSTSGWWCKSVQLDLEARGELVREPTKPLRWYKA